MKIDINKITDYDVQGIDHSDAHDYADAYISQATYDDPKTGERELSDEEIEGISSSDKYDLIIKYIYWNIRGRETAPNFPPFQILCK